MVRPPGSILVAQEVASYIEVAFYNASIIEVSSSANLQVR